ncbi:MAG TPA: transposase [Chloroflexota bacterium]|nr:transposase [Chloroflexota bacterium]
MRKTFCYRLYPTEAQTHEMQRQLDIGREVYNACLDERRACYRTTGKSLTYYDQANQLKSIRRECPDVATVNFSMLQAVCRRAHRSFEGFFRRLKAGQRAGYPRFKSRDRWDSITFPAYGDGCKLTSTRLYLQGVGQIKVKLHRPVTGTIKTVTLRRKAGHWYVCLSCEAAAAPLPATGASVGIDVGLTHFLTTDTGATVANPRPLQEVQRRLRVAGRALARCERGSHRRRKVKRRIAALYEKVANTRKDFHHKTAHALVQANDAICHEDVRVANMVQNHALARSISDAAWGQFIAILTSKAAEAGRQVIAVDPRGTSQTCLCGAHVPKTLKDRWHDCPACGLSLPRDQVSAMLIKRLGHSRQAPTQRDTAHVA